MPRNSEPLSVWPPPNDDRDGLEDALEGCPHGARKGGNKFGGSQSRNRVSDRQLIDPETGEIAQKQDVDGNTKSPMPFRFESRNRRPPTDPVNALLSLAYAMLARHFTGALAMVGLDPYRGFYHAPRYGRPALALDIMEPFRPIISDSVVLLAINSGEISIDDFVVGTTGTALTTPGRRRFIGAFERRLSLETTHPIFGYRLSMRRLLIMQARLLIRHLLGEFPTYPHYLPR